MFFLFANKGLTSRDRSRCAKGVMKEGCGATSTYGKNRLRSSLLEGTGSYSVSSNQSNKWVESDYTRKNCLTNFRLLRIKYQTL